MGEWISPFPSLAHLLQERARGAPNDTAYTFLIDGEYDVQEITYGELDRHATRIAHELAQRDLRGERALLLFPPGLGYIEAFFGCLYAGVTAVPAYPPLGERGAERLDAIVRDSTARVALTSTPLSPAMLDAFAAPLSWISTHELTTPAASDERSQPWDATDIGPAATAFLQYTSGSTRTPRGVVLTHSNLLHNLETMHGCFATGADDVLASWLPPYHDMGLIGAILVPLFGGFPAVLMSPLHFLSKPLRWLQMISRYRATISPAPNFAYELCVRKIRDHVRSELDLSAWRAAVNGAEPVRPDTLARFIATFADSGFAATAFRPSYGLAEGTLLVSSDPLDTPIHQVYLQGTPRIASGTAQGGQRVVVVNRTTLGPAAIGEVGEIWVSGPSVASGYWGRPEESEAIFAATLPDGSGPFLRTGDLGVLDEHQALVVTGRLRDLIILGGRNVYPQDVEFAAEQGHPALRAGCGAAFGVSVNDQERLVVVFEVAEGADIDAVTVACRRAIREYNDVDLYELVLIRPRTIPKTSSGKIQRSATRAAYLAGTLSSVGGWSAESQPDTQVEYTPPRNPLESLIVDIWTELLGTERKIGVHEEFFGSGGQSVLLSHLAARLEDELPIRVTVGDVFEAPTVAALAALLDSRPLLTDETELSGLIADHEVR